MPSPPPPEAKKVEALEIAPVKKKESRPISVSKLAHKAEIIRNKKSEVSINNRGEIENFYFKDSVYFFRDTIGKEGPLSFEITKNNEKSLLSFTEIVSQTEGEIVFKDPVLGIVSRFKLDEKGKLQVKFNSVDSSPFLLSVKLKSSAKTLDNNQRRDFLLFDTDITRFAVGDEEKGEGSFSWIGVDFNYHLFAVSFSSSLAGKYYTEKENDKDLLNISFVKENKSIDFEVVYTKKNYDLLIGMGNNLDKSVDFGFFWPIAVPILRGLQFFYQFFPNYGVAIILLTLLIRLITFPLQFKSFKSMKKMQKIGPEIQKIKEKFKDDPQRVQKETMELFKKAKANPLGGCLPLLLQMPIFVAFYQVLYNSIELVGAPFYFWIHDLSLRDPFFVLPIFMGISMLAQTKLNPSATMDDAQKKNYVDYAHCFHIFHERFTCRT